MNVDLDIHDILRNLLPGLIFLIVLISYDFCDGVIDCVLLEFDNFGEAALALIFIYPIGFIIQSIYRFIHIEFGEQERMETFESVHFTKDTNISFGENYFEEREHFNQAKVGSYALDIFFWKTPEGSAFRPRAEFFVTRIHSLGAVATAIILGSFLIASYLLICVTSVLMDLHAVIGSLQLSLEPIQFLYGWLMIIFWLIMVFILTEVRSNYQEAFQVSMRHFIYTHRGELIRFFRDQR